MKDIYTPIQFIDRLNKSDPYLKKIYTRGSCYQFALLLQSFYPEGVIYIRNDKKHTAILIQDVLYDISGVVSNQDKFTPITQEEIVKCERWSSDRNLVVIEKKLFKKIEKKIKTFHWITYIFYTVSQLIGSLLIYLVYQNFNYDNNKEFKWFVIIVVVVIIIWIEKIKKESRNKN